MRRGIEQPISNWRDEAPYVLITECRPAPCFPCEIRQWEVFVRTKSKPQSLANKNNSRHLNYYQSFWGSIILV